MEGSELVPQSGSKYVTSTPREKLVKALAAAKAVALQAEAKALQEKTAGAIDRHLDSKVSHAFAHIVRDWFKLPAEVYKNFDVEMLKELDQLIDRDTRKMTFLSRAYRATKILIGTAWVSSGVGLLILLMYLAASLNPSYILGVPFLLAGFGIVTHHLSGDCGDHVFLKSIFSRVKRLFKFDEDWRDRMMLYKESKKFILEHRSEDFLYEELKKRL